MTKKTVIGLGDSILLQASSELAQCFCRYHVTYLDTEKGLALDPLDRNVGPSTALPAYIDIILEKGLYADVLILACGLHDIRHVSGSERPMVAFPNVADNLEHVFVRARQVARKTVWVLMIPVFDKHHNARLEDKRFDLERKQYNEIAERIANRHGVIVIDSKDLLEPFDSSGLIDHVHLNRSLTKRYAEGLCMRVVGSLFEDSIS